MKEVTYEDWQKNSTPRMMWVWDDDEKDKVQRKVFDGTLIREDDSDWKEPLVEV